MDKEATTSNLAILDFVTIITEGSINKTTEFTSLNDLAGNFTKNNNDTDMETKKAMYQSTVKTDSNNLTSTDLVELNGLDSEFTEQTNSTTKTTIFLTTNFTKEINENIINLTGERSQSLKPINVSLGVINVQTQDFQYVTQNLVSNESINEIANSTSEHGDGYKNVRHYNIQPKQLDFFGSFIKPNTIRTDIEQINKSLEHKTKNKYILQWTKNDSLPFTEITSTGQEAFIRRNCSYTNCVIIRRNSSIINYEIFDAVVFFAKDFAATRKHRKALRKLLRKRLPHQKYVFASLNYQKIQRINRYNNFFNWTWTYKLNSDLTWSPFVVKDINGIVVAPNANVTWLKKEEMFRVSEDLMKVLTQKSMPIILFYPCNLVPSRTFCYVRKLIRLLKIHYGLYVDKISMCWYKYATKDIKALFSKVIKRDYYFYIAFENNEGEDYITDKFIEAVDNFAVPIMFGGANYSRFLPDGSYLDASKYTPHTLGREIYKLLRDIDLYAEYFKWKNHYSIHRPEESPQTDYICRMCELMNDENKLKEITVYKNFTDWWSQKYGREDILKKNYDNFISSTQGSIFALEQKPQKQSIAKEIIQKSAKAYTSLVDSVIHGVKSAFTTFLG